MRYRKFRIAWSVAWGLLAVLLVVLCLRSYWRKDYIRRVDPDQTIAIGSDGGAIRFTQAPIPSMRSTSIWEFETGEASEKSPPAIRFSRDAWSAVFLLELPLWLLVSASAAVAIAPW